VHWVVIDMEAHVSGLPQGGRPLPAGARSGLNDWHRIGYGGQSSILANPMVQRIHQNLVKDL
jgi:phosphatidylethanolamine-binding protein (PEBP) family uncharacterized protein